jgi:Flp pilus assembly protein TadG
VTPAALVRRDPSNHEALLTDGRAARRRWRSEHGQTIALLAVFLTTLLGIAAIAIDVGSWYQDRRHLQNDADAAALAGASYLPAGTAASAASASFAKNKLNGETVAVAFPTADTVKVTVNYVAPAFFAKVLGRSSATIQATATAQIQGSGTVGHHVSPYAVLRTVYNNGAGTQLFTCNGSGATSNCGTVDLPTAANTTGGSCSGSVYTGNTSNISATLADTNDIGPVVLGGCLSPKPGATQGSATAVDSLQGTINQDLKSVGSGAYEIIPQTWDDPQHLPPRLIYVPIVDAFSQGTQGPWTITGFAWFYMTGSTGHGSSLTIGGKFVSIDSPPTGGTTVAWVPGQVGQVTSVALIG